MTSVLVVDDSRLMRTVLERQLTDRGYTVHTARNGERAVEAVAEFDPDAITMDVHMPKMDGIEAVEQIMSTNPVPIIMLSAHTKEDAETTLNALEKGAVEFLMKPDGQEVSMRADEIIDKLVDTIEAVVDVDVSPTPTPTESTDWFTDSPGVERFSTEDISIPDTVTPTIIIGASTGGPGLVESILRELPVSLHARVIVVQHMPKNFTERFAERLDAASAYRVREATNTTTVSSGEAVVAPGDKHLTISGDVDNELLVELDDRGPVHGIIPSIDVSMESASNVVKHPMVGVALTGMGQDGAEGVKAIKDAGGSTIAQDEDTSTVFGIPARAIETGCVDMVLPDSSIVQGVVNMLNKTGDPIHG